MQSAFKVLQKKLTGGLKLIPIIPRRRSHVRKVYFSLVLVVLIRLALLWFNACAEMARQSCIGLDFSCVGSGIKEPKLNGSLLEHTVQVQTVVHIC